MSESFLNQVGVHVYVCVHVYVGGATKCRITTSGRESQKGDWLLFLPGRDLFTPTSFLSAVF